MPSQAGALWEVQPLTRTMPTTPAEGLAIGGLESLMVVVEAAPGATLTGTGALRCVLWEDLLGAGEGEAGAAAGGYARAPWLDLTIPEEAAGQRRWAFEPWEIYSARAMRALYLADGVGVSGGDAVTVYLLGDAEALAQYLRRN